MKIEKDKLVIMFSEVYGIKIKENDIILKDKKTNEKVESENINIENGFIAEAGGKILSYQSWTGNCWWCSNPFANLSSNSWYDPYYRYYNTCSCNNWVLYCCSYGYTKNDYHTCNPLPTKITNSKTNRYGVTTRTEYCSYCGYYYSVTY